jgi:very-short-patch-repair endonuclease
MSKTRNFDFKEIKKQAQELRNNLTESEKLLWKELRGRKLSGLKFLRQHLILYKGNLIRYNYFIADFYCYEKKAVIELDGPVHDTTEEYDQYRDSELQELGIHILRIRNEEIENMKEVLNKIRLFLNKISK